MELLLSFLGPILNEEKLKEEEDKEIGRRNIEHILEQIDENLATYYRYQQDLKNKNEKEVNDYEKRRRRKNRQLVGG